MEKYKTGRTPLGTLPQTGFIGIHWAVTMEYTGFPRIALLYRTEHGTGYIADIVFIHYVVRHRIRDRSDVSNHYINTIGHYCVRKFGDKRITYNAKFILKDNRAFSYCEKSSTLNQIMECFRTSESIGLHDRVNAILRREYTVVCTRNCAEVMNVCQCQFI